MDGAANKKMPVWLSDISHRLPCVLDLLLCRDLKGNPINEIYLFPSPAQNQLADEGKAKEGSTSLLGN